VKHIGTAVVVLVALVAAPRVLHSQPPQGSQVRQSERRQQPRPDTAHPVLRFRISGSDSLREPPSAATLAAISDRGRMLAESDVAAGRGSSAVLSLGPLASEVNRYIARKTEAGWEVVFGRSSASKDTFFVSYEARKASGDGYYSAEAFASPRADTAFYARAARAIDVALEDFRGELRPYTMAALPAEGEGWWVYFTPAQTESGVFPLGADSRYHISADGRTILERRRLHKSVIEYSTPSSEDRNDRAAGVHVAVLDDVPEDTDVSHVLARFPAVPEYITTNAFVFRIDVDGTIRYLGRRDEVMR
jgi:hypothetical protein